MSATTFQMPHPFDVPSLVKAYQNNTGRGRVLLVDDTLRESLDEVIAAGDAFTHLLTTDETKTQPADFDLDGAWGGINAIVGGVQRALTRRGPTPLSEEQEARLKRAQELQQYWIGNDLRFLTLNYRSEWRESEFRIRRLQEPMAEGLESPEAALAGLGLSWAVERLVAVHETYGHVLGLGEVEDTSKGQVMAWEKALNRFLSGVQDHHSDDPLVMSMFLTPYEAALAAGRDRRRQANDKR